MLRMLSIAGSDSGSKKPIRNRWQPTATVSEHGKEGVDRARPRRHPSFVMHW
jgi:hypothetical protein